MKNLNKNGAISNWLFFCCALVFLMVSVGAVTRLTQSGLSITEWHPVIGAVPPLDEAQWNHAFDLYKQSPEFIKKHSWMKPEDFKKIFFWEWFHRFLGRLIGLVYAVPFFWFLLRRKIPEGYGWKLFGVLLLGGAQGVLGWYMVMSGLVDRPEVSQFRLAAHLLLALLIYVSMLWLGLSIRGLETREKPPGGQKGDRKLFAHGLVVFLFLIATICWGAFTAGLKGGLIYNDSFPKMGGVWISPEAYISVFNQPAGAQFLHRWLAMATMAMVLGFWAHGYFRKKTFPALHGLAVMVFIQIGLGMATLFSRVMIPLAALHQAGAVVLLTLLVASLRRLRD